MAKESHCNFTGTQPELTPKVREWTVRDDGDASAGDDALVTEDAQTTLQQVVFWSAMSWEDDVNRFDTNIDRRLRRSTDMTRDKGCIEPEGRFAKAFREIPVTHLWSFWPVAFASNKGTGYSEKVPYRCIGCGAKVWDKGGMGLLCEFGNVFTGETGESKVGLA